MSSRRINIALSVSIIVLYHLNRLVSPILPSCLFKLFLACYFNDMLCGALIVAYSNFILSFYRGNFYFCKLWQISLLVLACGLFWEFVTPVFRQSSIGDPLDIAAYLAGGGDVLAFLTPQKSLLTLFVQMPIPTSKHESALRRLLCASEG